MSTIAFRASLVREIEQSMERIHFFPDGHYLADRAYQDGQLDAYAHVLQLIKDEDL